MKEEIKDTFWWIGALHGKKDRKIKINVTKIINWCKKRKEKKPDFEFDYNHTNLVCKEPWNRDNPYCPKCGGETIRRNL